MQITYVPMEFTTSLWWGTTEPNSGCVVETAYTTMVPILVTEAE